MAKRTYTYEDFLQSARKAGLLAQFSEGDLRLAQQNPDAGMSLLTYKRDYRNASTDEARALANAGAERIRSVYGGYTAGADGSGFYLNESEGDKDRYVNQFADEQRALIDRLSTPFSYDSDGDAAWQSYRKAYIREGRRAYEDSLGTAAANTGGVASTAAVTAAQQALNYYNAQAADKKAALQQQAYQNWLAERAQTVSELEAYDRLDQTAAAQYQWAQDAAAAQARWESEAATSQMRWESEAAAAQARWESEAAETRYRWEQEMAAAATKADREAATAAAAAEAAAEQQRFDNAMAVWKTYGYVTPGIAEILSLPAGTAYSEQAYNAWRQRFEEATNGVYTGMTMGDTVNAVIGEEAGSYNPAAGDSPSRHGRVSQGSSGSDVLTMQTYLIALGYHCGDTGADGIFGSATRAAVRAFQSDHGLAVDGVCGPKTWYALIAALNG